MSETETTETQAAPDVFDGDSISSDPEWQAAMEGDQAGETGEGEAAKTGEEDTTEKSGAEPEAGKAETGQEAKDDEVETAETTEKPAEEPAERKPSPQVPLHVLQQERDKRHGVEKQLAELKGRFDEFSKPPPTPPVDREAEVQKLIETQDLTQAEAEIRLDQNQIMQEMAEQKEFRANLEKRQSDEVEIQHVQAQYSASATKFAEKQTDFSNAYSFALNARATQLRFENPEATEAQINQSIYISEINLAAASIKAGKDPAEVVYEYAKTFGYSAPEGGGNGASGVDIKGSEAEKKLLNIQKGEEASKSASTGGGGDTGEGLTFDTLKNKKGKEFDSGWDELVPRQDSIFD